MKFNDVAVLNEPMQIRSELSFVDRCQMFREFFASRAFVSPEKRDNLLEQFRKIGRGLKSVQFNWRDEGEAFFVLKEMETGFD